jgi:hypothetical protein
MPKHKPDALLTAAEQELSRLAGELETLVKDDDYFRAVLGLGHRARTLFFGFLHAMEGPAPAAAMSLLRPGVEINLLLRFFGRDPVLHPKLWIAEGDRQRLAFINEFEQDSYLQQRWGAAPVDRELKEELQREVDEARRQALAAGVPGVGQRGPLLPGARAIVDYLDDPGAREAYTLAYRSLGADVHAGPYAFLKAEFVGRGGGRVSFHESLDPAAYQAARTLSLTMFASTLCIVASVLQLPVADAADEVKRRFVDEQLPLAERIRLQEGGND